MSSDVSIATVNPSGGDLHGIGAGIATITYNFPTGGFVTHPVTVNPLPPAITGILTVCTGMTTALSDAAAGGTWSSSSPPCAAVSAATGVVTGVSAPCTSIITYTLATGCQTTSVVTVNPSPTAIAGSLVICPGTANTLSDGAMGGIWTSSNTGCATVGLTTGVVTGTSGPCTSTITYTLPTGCYSTVIITINPVPTLSSSLTPAATCSGVLFSYPAASSSPGTTLNWTRAIVPGISNPSASGAGNPNEVLINTTTLPVAVTYVYTLNAGGCINTHNVIVTVNPAPANITGVLNFCAGTTTTLSDATPGGIWSSSNTDCATITAAGVVSGMSGPCSSTITYSFPATGCSTTATVNVTPGPRKHTVFGGGSYCPGSPCPDVRLDTADIGINYQLYCGGVPVGATLAGAGPTLDFGAQCSDCVYTIVATDAVSGCTSTMTGSATVTKLTACTITGVTSLCVGDSTALSGCTGCTWISTITTIASVGICTGVVTGIAAGVTNISYVSSGGCLSVVPVTVNPAPTACLVTGGGSYCVGQPCPHIFLNCSQIGTSYQLYLGAVAVGVPVAGTAASIDFGAQCVAGSYTITATNLTTGCSRTMPNSVTVTILPLPAAFPVTGGGSYCAGSACPHIGLSGSQTGVNYSLMCGSTVLSVVSGTNAPIDFGMQCGSCVYTVIATNVATGCTNTMTGSATVTIAPAPADITGTRTICPSDVTVLADASAGGTWSSSSPSCATVDFVTGVVTGLTGPCTSIITYTLPSGCTATATVTVVPVPAVHATLGGGSYCAGQPCPHILLDTTETGVSYQLYCGSTAVGVPVPGTTGSTLDFGAACTACVYTIVASNPATGCSSQMGGSATVSVNPLPAVYSVTGGGSYCGGSCPHVGLNGSQTGVNYQLMCSGAAVTTLAGTGAPLDFGAKCSSCTYTVVATNAVTGCTNTMTGSAAVTMTTPCVITGASSICVGTTTTLYGCTGCTWSSSNVSIATVGACTGVAGGVSAGVVVLTYTSSAGCVSTFTMTVNPLPTACTVTGGGGYCSGQPCPACPHVGLGCSQAGVTYQLYCGSAAVSSLLAGTGASLDFGMQCASCVYTIKANNLINGCSNTMTGSVSVSSTAPCTITGTHTMCVGHTATFSAAPCTGGTWSSSTPATVAATTGGVVTAIAAGTATISYLNAGGCTSTFTVTVSAMPATPTVGCGGGSVCTGGTVTLTGSPVAPGDNFYWMPLSVPAGTGPFGTLSSAYTNPTTFTGTGSGVQYITYVVYNGCGTSTVTTAVSVNALPAITGSSHKICVGQALTLSNSAGAGNWSCSPAGVASLSPTSGSSFTNATGVLSGGAATITYTSPSGCQATWTVTVNGAPSISPTTVNGCPGTTATLTGSTAGAWSITGGGHATLPSPLPSGTTAIVSLVNGGTDVVTLTSASTGCQATMTVNVYPASTISGSSTVCMGSSITLTGSGGGTWGILPTTHATISAAGVVTGTTTSGGPYTVTVTYTNSHGCQAQKVVTVDAVPGAGTITVPPSCDLCAGGTITCTNATSTPTGVWSLSGCSFGTLTTTSATTADLHTSSWGSSPASQLCTVTYTVHNSCGTHTTTKSVTINSCAHKGAPAGAAAPVKPGMELKVFPNPNQGTFTVKLQSDTNEPAEVKISNAIGETVKKYTTTTNSEDEINIKSVPGIYLVTVTTAHGSEVSRVVVQ